GGIAVLLYHRFNAASLALRTLLLPTGIYLPTQLYNRLREELERLGPRDALARTVADLAGPALLATLGPTAVFLCCALSEYKGLGELGVLAAVGLLLNYAVMITVLPALLAIVPARWWMPHAARPAAGAWFAAAGRFAA